MFASRFIHRRPVALLAPKNPWFERYHFATAPTARGFAMGGGDNAHDGAVYVLKGYDGSSVLNNAAKFDVSSGQWTTLATDTTGTAVFRHSQTVVDGVAYCIGGNDGTSAVADVRAYDIASDSWSALSPLPDARYYASVAAGGGYIYVCGGISGAGATTQTVYVYDIANGTWSSNSPFTGNAIAAIPVVSAGGAAAIYKGKLYYYNGRTSAPDVGALYSYDLSTDGPWQTVSSHPSPSTYSTAVQAGNDLYVLCGQVSGAYTSQAYKVDLTTGTWTQLRNIVHPGASAAAGGVINGVLYIAGGVGTGGATHGYISIGLDSVFPISPEWTDITESPTGTSHGSVSCSSNMIYGGKMYAAWGYNGSSNVATVEAYDPSTDGWSTVGTDSAGGVRNHQVARIGGKIYRPGGDTSGSGITAFRMFDIDAGTFSSLASLPGGRMNAGCCADAATGSVYVLGGRSAWNGYNNNFWRYDVASNTWANDNPHGGGALPALPYGCAFNAGACYGTKVFVFIGRSSTATTAEVYVCDLSDATPTWTKVWDVPKKAYIPCTLQVDRYWFFWYSGANNDIGYRFDMESYQVRDVHPLAGGGMTYGWSGYDNGLFVCGAGNGSSGYTQDVFEGS